MTDHLITTRQAAELANLTPAMIANYINKGRLPAQKLGTLFLIQFSDFSHFLFRYRSGEWKPGRPPFRKAAAINP
jgi:excisionase family DNA binding protein